MDDHEAIRICAKKMGQNPDLFNSILNCRDAMDLVIKFQLNISYYGKPDAGETQRWGVWGKNDSEVTFSPNLLRAITHCVAGMKKKLGIMQLT